LRQLGQLESLDLSYCQLVTLPFDVIRFLPLRSLALAGLATRELHLVGDHPSLERLVLTGAPDLSPSLVLWLCRLPRLQDVRGLTHDLDLRDLTDRGVEVRQ
jgi:hypothetical protein